MPAPFTQDKLDPDDRLWHIPPEDLSPLSKTSRAFIDEAQAINELYGQRDSFFNEKWWSKPSSQAFNMSPKRPPLRPFDKSDAHRRATAYGRKDSGPEYNLRMRGQLRDQDALNKFFYPSYRRHIGVDGTPNNPRPSHMYGPGWNPNDPHRYTRYGFNPWGAQVEGFPRPSDPSPFHSPRWQDMPDNPDRYLAARTNFEHDRRAAEIADRNNIIEAIRTLHNAGIIQLSEEATLPSEKAAAKEMEELKEAQRSGKPIEFKPEGSVVPQNVKEYIEKYGPGIEEPPDMEKENRRRRREAID